MPPQHPALPVAASHMDALTQATTPSGTGIRREDAGTASRHNTTSQVSSDLLLQQSHLPASITPHHNPNSPLASPPHRNPIPPHTVIPDSSLHHPASQSRLSSPLQLAASACYPVHQAKRMPGCSCMRALMIYFVCFAWTVFACARARVRARELACEYLVHGKVCERTERKTQRQTDKQTHTERERKRQREREIDRERRE